MAVSCEPSDLTAAAKCLDCIPNSMQMPVMIYLLATIAGETTDAAALVLKAKCLECIPHDMQMPVMNFLLCTIATQEGA